MPRRTLLAWLADHPPAAAALALLAILLPVLFKHPAESGDPVEYYNAARCVAERLVCAAHDHWSARWPVFAPTGLLFGLFGESRATMGLLPHLQALAAVALFAAILQRCFGRETALVGGLLFAAMPLTSELAMHLNADMLELCFLLAGMLALIVARERGGVIAWLIAGAMFALAVETRTTAVVTAATIGAALLLMRWPIRSLLLVAAGGAAILATSCAVQWLTTGDPFHAIRLALSHTKVPTAMLPPGTDTSGSPFFNLELIRNWQRNVSVHWTVDPVLNLLANASAGALVSAGAILCILGRTGFRGDGGSARALCGLALGACAVFLTICFVLSIHPTPRMFLPVIAAVAAMIALIVSGPRRDLRALVLYGLVPLMMLHSVASRLLSFDPIDIERSASIWLTAERRPASTDWLTHRHLNASAEVRALPEDRAGAGPLLILTEHGCERSTQREPGWRILRSAPLERSIDPLIAWIDSFGLVQIGNPPWSLCLYDR